MLLKVLKFEEKLEKFESLVKQLRQERQEDQKTFQNRVSRFEVEFDETQRQLNESIARIKSLERMDNDTQRLLNESLERIEWLERMDKDTQRQLNESLERIESLERMDNDTKKQLNESIARIKSLERIDDDTLRQLNESLERIESIERMDNDTQRQLNESLERIKSLDKIGNDTQRQLDESIQRMDNLFRDSKAHTEKMVRNITKHEDVAFTVKKPAETSGIFKEIVTNEGSGYSTSDGTFTCRVPGLYFFSAYLIKKRTATGSSRIDMVNCRICKNNVHVMQVQIDPEDSTADYGSYGVSSAVYLRLKSGDIVNMCGCVYVPAERSSFSGLLVSRESG